MIGFFVLIRMQTAVGDTAFLKSMIPYHLGAILMCDRASITDLEINRLCGAIMRSQRDEITQMNALIQKVDKQPRSPSVWNVHCRVGFAVWTVYA